MYENLIDEMVVEGEVGNHGEEQLPRCRGDGRSCKCCRSHAPPNPQVHALYLLFSTHSSPSSPANSITIIHSFDYAHIYQLTI